MSIPNNYLATGPSNSFRVTDNRDGTWSVEGTDNNGVWVDADPGATYESQDEAEKAAEAWADSRGGEFIGVLSQYSYATDSASGAVSAYSLQSAYDDCRFLISDSMIEDGATLFVEDEATGERITLGIDGE